LSDAVRNRSRATLPILFSVVVVELIGFGIVVPVLPFYAKAYGASATVLGFLVTVYAAGQFLCAPLWGRLSDRIGRRAVMLLTIAGNSLSLLALGLADSLAWIFLARLLGGCFAANVSVASAYIADVTGDEERTRWMGVLGASFGVGFLLGPAVGGALAPYGYSVPMLAAAALSGANLAYAAFALQEPTRRVHAGAGEAGDALSTTRIGVLRNPVVRRLCLGNLAFALAVTQLETIFAFLMMDRFGYDAWHVAFILVLMAAVMGAIQGGGMRALSERFTERALVVAGSLILGASFLAVPYAPTVALLLVPLVAAAAGRAVAQPSMMSLTSLAATPESRGAVMGTFQSSASLARIVGPVAAGWLYDLALPAPFWLAAALLSAVALLGRGLPTRDT
jgi:DHA1 family tetracycline resistance protein-like MFS transporter